MLQYIFIWMCPECFPTIKKDATDGVSMQCKRVVFRQRIFSLLLAQREARLTRPQQPHYRTECRRAIEPLHHSKLARRTVIVGSKYVVDQTILKCLLCSQVVVTVGVLHDTLHRLPGCGREDFVYATTQAQNLAGSDF